MSDKPKCEHCPLAHHEAACPAIKNPHPFFCRQVDPADTEFNPHMAAVIVDMAGLRPPPAPPIAAGGELTIRAPLSPGTGFSRVARELARALEAGGIRVRLEESAGGSPHVATDHPDGWVLQVAPVLTAPPRGRPWVAFTMWETTHLPARVEAVLNRAEAVIVPSEWNRAVFRDSGVTRPIFVAPLGVESADGGFSPRGSWDAELRTTACTFGLAGRVAHGGPRKGIQEGIDAFVAAFPHELDVALDVRVGPDDVLALRWPADGRIRILTERVSDDRLAAWYRSLAAYVCPSKGEGWGFHALEAMASGAPVLAARWGGTAEFFDERFGRELAYDLAPAVGPFVGQGEWAVPRPESLIESMRWVRANRDLARDKGRAAASRATEFGWDATGRALRSALRRAGVLVEYFDDGSDLAPAAGPQPAERAVVTSGCGCGQGAQPAPTPPAPVDYPSLWQQAKNVAQAAAGFVASGFALAPAEVAEERLATCRGCDRLDAAQKRCVECGCFVELKVRVAGEHCPLGRWPALSPALASGRT